MKQREIQDENNIRWQCVQALSGADGPLAKKARGEENIGELVEVVCTPSGGAQSVRLTLPSTWHDSSSDDELLKAIKKDRSNKT